MELYNSEVRRKEKFKTLKDRQVTIYTCGPTVYHFQHIGNYRTYVSWDLLVKFLRFSDYTVNHVMNITDVGHLTQDDLLSSDAGEDKMEKAAKRDNKTVWDVAKFYTDDFLEGFEKLHVSMPNTVCKATDHIPGMIVMIEKLIENKKAYVTKSGVYFDIQAFPEYGRLSGNTLDELAVGASGRVEDLEDKKSPHDFALWVLGKEQSMMWDSPWGRGYPGWHIECSAMSNEFLGEHIDIHGGAIDNKFPHHECEIAQSECAAPNKKLPFVKYWMHAGHMTVEGEKMAKSKGNVYLLGDVEAQGFTMQELRFFYLRSHYRSSSDFTWKELSSAKESLKSIHRFVDRLEGVKGDGVISMVFSKEINSFLGDVVVSLEDDLGTPEAFAHVFEFMTKINSRMDAGELNEAEAKVVVQLWKTLDTVFGVLFPWEVAVVPDTVELLARKRLEAKKEKDFGEADRLRGEIEVMGYVVEDTGEGYVVRKR